MTLCSQLQMERDTFRDETRDLNHIKTSAVLEKAILMSASRDKINRLEHKIKRLVETAEKIEDQL